MVLSAFTHIKLLFYKIVTFVVSFINWLYGLLDLWERQETNFTKTMQTPKHDPICWPFPNIWNKVELSKMSCMMQHYSGLSMTLREEENETFTNDLRLTRIIHFSRHSSLSASFTPFH